MGKAKPQGVDISQQPPFPPVVFRIGVTGHRPNRLPSEIAALEEQLERVLRSISRSVLSLPRSQPPNPAPRLRLLSSLAEGVDRMAAACALELGYELQVPLPLPRNEYAEDFDSEASKRDFDQLLARAKSVFELESSPAHRDFSYRAAGHIVLRQCDLLVAVWDGEPSRGVGGTSELIDSAQEAGRPVLLIDSFYPHLMRLNGSTADAMAGVHDLIRDILSEPPEASWKGASQLADESWPKRIPTTSYTLLRLLGEHRCVRAPAPDAMADTGLESTLLSRYFGWFDALAVLYGERSRSAAMRMQLLALGAVIAAILILPFEEHRSWLQFFSTCEVFCIVWLIAEAARSRRSDWHARWITYRSLSERLRCLDFLGPLTETVPTHFADTYLGASMRDQDLSTYFIDAVSREMGLVPAQVNESFLADRTRALSNVLEQQAGFQHRVAHRYEAVEATLQRIGISLFVVAVVLCLLDLVRAVAPEIFERMNQFGVSGIRLATAAAIIPALGAALAGLAAQGEYKRLATRAASMSTTLQTIRAELEANPRPNLRALQSLAIRVAEVLTSEVQDWQVLVAAKPPSLPT